MTGSPLETKFLALWGLLCPHLPAPLTQYRFLPPRRFRADFCWLSPYNILVEIDGGGWIRGRHHRGKGYAQDRVRDLLALGAGWLVIRLVEEQLDDPSTFEVLASIFSDRASSKKC